MHLIGKPPIRAGIITGSSRVLCHTDRIAGFQDQIGTLYPDIRILETRENSDDEFESYSGTLAMLQDHPDLNALYFAAGGVYGGCRAILAAGRTDITVISCDNVPTTRELLLSGVIDATICQQPSVQGSLPLELLFTYLTTAQKPAREYNYTSIAYGKMPNYEPCAHAKRGFGASLLAEKPFFACAYGDSRSQTES